MIHSVRYPFDYHPRVTVQDQALKPHIFCKLRGLHTCNGFNGKDKGNEATCMNKSSQNHSTIFSRNHLCAGCIRSGSQAHIKVHLDHINRRWLSFGCRTISWLSAAYLAQGLTEVRDIDHIIN
ncbi:hypothetical protein ES288_A07G155800v1 [Gossypium darwinii]|uniref:Uncharacterized protein n=1 Tax=Gossypium darwinii TaxID=34276 RepID=A0A5D2FXY6_GOSDA|nr:hypothetical protein ES288_A07G155800v1 [Gossypium darwinii]